MIQIKLNELVSYDLTPTIRVGSNDPGLVFSLPANYGGVARSAVAHGRSPLPFRGAGR